METSEINDASTMNKPASVWPVAWKWGLITAMLLIVYTMIVYYVSDNPMNRHWSGTVISALIYIFGMFMAMKEYRDQHADGVMTYSKGVGVAAAKALVVALIFLIFGFVYTYYIMDFNAFMDTQMQENISKMKEMGTSDADIRKSVEMGKKIGKPMTVAAFGFMSFIFDFIVGLVVAAIVKKSDQPN